MQRIIYILQQQKNIYMQQKIYLCNKKKNIYIYRRTKYTCKKEIYIIKIMLQLFLQFRSGLYIILLDEIPKFSFSI